MHEAVIAPCPPVPQQGRYDLAGAALTFARCAPLVECATARRLSWSSSRPAPTRAGEGTVVGVASDGKG